MSGGGLVWPQPRPDVASPGLSRPDWTVPGRDAGGRMALDKNESTDPYLHSIIDELRRSVPVSAMTQYPECARYYLELADYLDVPAKSLLFTAGSDGAIRTVFETFISVGDVVMRTEPTFAMYPVYTKMFGARAVRLEYRASSEGPVLGANDIVAAVAEHRPRLLCLPNPDSPTGTLLQADEVERIVEHAAHTGALVLVDEAYHPFSETTAIGLVSKWKNLVVARTFAKAWGLAGLRIGYVVAHPDTTLMLHKVRPMYEVNGFALEVMAGLIRRRDDVIESVRRINAGRDAFLSRVKKLGLRTLNGGGNFVHVAFGANADRIHAALADRVLYRRDFSDPCLSGFSRFTTAPVKIMDELASMIELALP